jgi:hypothetical protein
MKSHCTLAVALLFSLTSFSQAWETRIHDPARSVQPNFVVPTADGGVLASGHSFHHFNPPYLSKIDATGMVQWNAFLDDSLTGNGGRVVVLPTGYICATQKFTGASSHTVVYRLDLSGNVTDTATFSFSADLEYPYWCGVSSDGNIFIADAQFNSAANSHVAMRLIKLDTNLQTIWVQVMPSQMSTFFNYCFVADDSAGVVACYSQLSDSCVFMRYNSAGTITWTKSYNGFITMAMSKSGASEYYCSITDSASYLQYDYIRLLRLDADCDTIWTRTIAPVAAPALNGQISRMAISSDKIYLLGRLYSYVTFNDEGGLLIQMDTAANVNWWRRVGASVNFAANGIGPMPSGGCAVVGFANLPVTGGDGYVIRVDSAGHTANAWIVGSAYADTNSNCTSDTLDIPMAGTIVTATHMLTSQQVWTATVSDGSFILPADTGSWNVNFTPTIGYYTPSCSFVTGFSGTIQQQFDSLYGQVPFEMIPNIHDLRVHLVAIVPPRPGRAFTYQLQYTNAGSCMESGSVSFRLDSIFVMDSTSSLPDTVNNNTLIWNFSNLAPLASASIFIHAYCDSILAIGTPSQQDAWIFPVVNDTTPNDNSFTHHQNVVASYDPNLKEVSPKGIGPAGNIPPQQGYLTYTVHFQNTGNDTAFNVVIRDSLSPFADPGTLQVLGNSHPYVLTVTADGVVSFRFLNILLPDSFTNEPASHGYIIFRMAVRNNLSDGSVIENTAGIYFDFNEVVMTNTVINTIDYWLGTDVIQQAHNNITVYPNPALESINVVAEGWTNGHFTITDLAGRTVKTGTFNSAVFSIERSGISEGCYVLSIADRHGEFISSQRIVFE